MRIWADQNSFPQSNARHIRSLPLQILLALFLIAAAAALTALIKPFAFQFVYGFFYLAVVLVCFWCAPWLGVATTLLAGLVGSYFFVDPPGMLLGAENKLAYTGTFYAIAGLLCVMIFLRNRSEAQLRERERFIENLANTAPYTLYLYDVAAERVDYVTPAASSPLAALNSEQALGAILPQHMHPDDRVRYEQHLSDLAARPDGVVLSFTHRSENAAGEWCWYERQERVYARLPGGAIQYVLGVAQDVTGRKQAEQKVLYQAQLLDTVDQAVIAVGLDQRITYWNRFAETLYGWTAEEAQGKKIAELVTPAAQRAQADGILTRLRGGSSWSGEFLLQRKDGSTFYADVIDAPIYDENGAVAGILGVSVDIVQRKRAETYLQFLADASLTLSSSLDYKTTIQRVADLAVPRIADWCAVDLLRADGTVELVAVAHVDPAKVRWAQDLRRRFPPSLADEQGLAKVIKSGEPEFYPDIPSELISQQELDEEQLAILQMIAMRSVIIVPLRARGAIIGALTLVWSESDRHYAAADVVFAEELAGRAAVAVDNARLYEEARVAEQQQAELLAQMEALIANAPIGISFMDRDLRYIRVNEALAQMNGLPVEAHLDHKMEEVAPGLTPVVVPFLREVLETGKPILNREISGIAGGRPGVEGLHVLASWYPVLAQEGKPQYVGTIIVDISERMRIEQALREEEERFRSTFEQAAVGIAHVALDGRWLRVNNRLCEIAGYTREELQQKTFQDITHPDDVHPDVQLVQQTIADEIDGYRLEKRYLRKDKAAVWVQLTVSLVRDVQTHNPLYFISVVEDISARKASEMQLMLLAESSRVLFTSLVDERALQAAAELLTAHLADWCVINLRRAAGADEVIEPVAVAHRNRDKLALLHDLVRCYPLGQQQVQGTPEVIRTGHPLFFPLLTAQQLQQDPQLSLLAPLGLASLIIMPLRARDQIIGSMTLARADVWNAFTTNDLAFIEELAQRIALAVDNADLYDSARTAETQLRQFNETLEERVVARTQELERSNDELDRFAYVASHDLKAPLRAIDNLSLWLYQDAHDLLPSESQQHLEKMRGRVQRMERLLDDLLAYSRAGRVQHAPQEVESGPLVRAIFDLLSPPPGFTLTVQELMPVLYTQRVPLETVLRNLLGNAFKHHDRPNGAIVVSARQIDGLVEFCIQDNGPGVAAEYHARIFDLFQTLQSRDQREGSGMGLAIVKKTVESAGGRVWLISTEGEGACFKFTWPAHEPEMQAVVE